MYLVDMGVISEVREGQKSSPDVRAFFERVTMDASEIYMSVATIGELRHGVERIRYRGDRSRARRLQRWFLQLTAVYEDRILVLDEETAHVWVELRVPNAENPLDRQIAATALIHDLVVVSRKVDHFDPQAYKFSSRSHSGNPWSGSKAMARCRALRAGALGEERSYG